MFFLFLFILFLQATKKNQFFSYVVIANDDIILQNMYAMCQVTVVHESCFVADDYSYSNERVEYKYLLFIYYFWMHAASLNLKKIKKLIHLQIMFNEYSQEN